MLNLHSYRKKKWWRRYYMAVYSAFGTWCLCCRWECSTFSAMALFYLIYYVVKYRRPLVRKHLFDSFPRKKRGRAHQDREGILLLVLRLYRRNHQALHDEQEAGDETHAVHRCRESKRIMPERPVVRYISGTLLQLGMGYLAANMHGWKSLMWPNIPSSGKQSLRQALPPSSQPPRS